MQCSKLLLKDFADEAGGISKTFLRMTGRTFCRRRLGRKLENRIRQNSVWMYLVNLAGEDCKPNMSDY
jgi:hypothetical protein